MKFLLVIPVFFSISVAYLAYVYIVAVAVVGAPGTCKSIHMQIAYHDKVIEISVQTHTHYSHIHVQGPRVATDSISISFYTKDSITILMRTA